MLSRNGAPTSTGIAVDIGPKKTQTITVKPNVPQRLGGYALVVDLGKAGRSFVTTFVRTFKPDPMMIHYPQITGDGNFGKWTCLPGSAFAPTAWDLATRRPPMIVSKRRLRPSVRGLRS